MNHTRLTFKYAVFFCILTLTASIAGSQNLSSAKILRVSGSVQIFRPSGGTLNRIKFGSGTELFPGDVIKTNFDGRLVIGLKDGSQAIISRETTVEIRDTNISPRTIFHILRGKTRIKIEKLGGSPNPYRITTPTTVIAVRGTTFDVFVQKDETRVFVLEGAVSVSRIDLPDIEVILTPGQFTRVRENQPPESPAPFKPGKNEDFFSSLPRGAQQRGVFDNPGRGDFPGNPGSFPGNAPRNAPGNTPGNNPNVPPNPGNNRRGKP